MKPLNTSKAWPPIAVFDIEATQWVNVVLLCHVDELGNRTHFASVSDYLDWLFTTPLDHVWAHWGGHYDNRFVIGELMRRNIEFEVVMSGSHAIITKAFPPGRNPFHFCDSGRLMPDSLAKIGKTIGLPKLDVDRGHMEKLTHAEMVEYCFRDCDIVVKGLQEMKRALGDVGADFAYTLASIATRWVRRSDVLEWHRFFQKSRKAGKNYKLEMQAADEYATPAFFGGRTEVFRVGAFTGPLYYYDVRSSYPWSMTQDLPTYPKGISVATGRGVERRLETCGITEADVHVPESTYLPLLPVYENGKLLFPVGRFRGRWTNLELIEALRAGASVKIRSQYLFEPTPFMEPFVRTFFGLRQEAIQEGDAMKSYAYKTLLNSGYGKLNETVERARLIYGAERVNKAMRDGEKVFPTNLPGIYKTTSEEEGAFRHVAAGAYVTARSRLLLWRKMQEVLRLGGRIFYCDTDSIVTDVPLPKEPDELGNLKLEYELAEFEAFAPKVYRMVTTSGDTYYKVKGTPVERGDDGEKLSADKAQERWEAYTSGIPIGKAGITGLLTDLRKGRALPVPETLSRAMRNADSKRRHENGDSRPLVLSS